ncbi:hypothetical protein GHT06_007315 [Daphnia sinensis]|uniref:CxC3 like cysteine cluster domain-containing protein n=1 Tax=Daphnia sinensis TaxID=1820382 RepID=A0AAD5PMA7_9CRUS|nr:hypothetical protein GHT06_007315 [Daphnia sinensis]
MAEVSSLSESENYVESDFETSSTEEKKKKNVYPKRKRKYHHLSEHFSKSKNNVKVKSRRKKNSTLSGDSLQHSSQSVQQPQTVSSFTTHHSANDIATDEFPSAISLEDLDKLRREVKNDLESMQCHGDLNFYAVRCMTCKRHLCHQCDANTHSSMPFHRRLLCSCETLETLQPHHFIDEEGNIITKDVCLPCFVPLKCCDVNCLGSMSLTPNLTESIVVVTEQGRFLLKGTNFVCDSCHTVRKATIDDYIFSGFFPASLSEKVTYLFSEEALLLGYYISHKCPGSSKNMYARTLEDVSKEYGRNGPINVPLFTTAEREWETCRHYIDQEVLKRDKTHCPSCGKEPLVRSSDVIVKLRRLSSAGKVHNPENERTQKRNRCVGDRLLRPQEKTPMNKRMARHFPEYRNLTSEMTGILPIMHKNAHQLPCKARKEIKQGTPKLEKLLETHNLVYNDLPLIHKELETKAKAILDQRKTKKTTVDTLRRMLEGLHAHLKTTSISISKEAVSLADKYNIVDCWMLLKRAREEITLSKNEMINYMRFLIDKRSSLQQPSQKHTGEDEKFAKGKSVMKVSEVHHLNLKIQMALTTFNLKCNQDFSDFVCETQTNHSEPEFEFDTSDEENYDSLSESEYSDEETESSSSYSEDDESAI